MPIPLYLALTAEEFSALGKKPANIAWMACHFSPYGKGLTNLPPQLPRNSIVILNDRIPWRDHDMQLIGLQLQQLQCGAVLLDLQRPDTPTALVSALTALPFPVCVGHQFADQSANAVLVPPCPPHIPLEQHLQPWTGLELWLEVSLEQSALRVTAKGAEQIPPAFCPTFPHGAPLLASHY